MNQMTEQKDDRKENKAIFFLPEKGKEDSPSSSSS